MKTVAPRTAADVENAMATMKRWAESGDTLVVDLQPTPGKAHYFRVHVAYVDDKGRASVMDATGTVAWATGSKLVELQGRNYIQLTGYGMSFSHQLRYRIENAIATMLGLPSDGAADYVDVLR